MQFEELHFLCQMIKEKAGIYLGEDKLYLFEARLLPVAAKLGYKNLSKFVNEFTKPPSVYNQMLQQEIIEAMTTNESMFFRDIKPFKYLTDIIIPEITGKSPEKDINIWCAACSSGQEPYSISMLAQENNYKNIKITASDIDGQILKKAKSGIYNQFEVQRGLATTFLMKYFTQSENNWHIKDNVKQDITFLQHNILENFNNVAKFDVVFCRYVLIYFDEATKLKAFERLGETMNKGSYLVLGGAETLPDSCKIFTSHSKERQILVRV